MRFLLAIMAMTLFAVSVGCEKPTDAPAAPATTEAGSDAAHEADGHEAAPTDGASAAATDETQTVSLKLPGMS